MTIGKSVILSFLAMFGSGLSPASALECPSPQMVTQPGALKETARTIAQRAQALAEHGQSAIPSMIYTLRRNFPKSTNAEITNYLITAYCPVLNKKAELSDGQRKVELEQFGNQVRANLQ